MAPFSVALLLLLSFVSAAQAVLVYNYNQCGGTGGVCVILTAVLCLLGGQPCLCRTTMVQTGFPLEQLPKHLILEIVKKAMMAFPILI